MPAAVKPRRFPPPWTIEEHNQACFIVRDKCELHLIFDGRIIFMPPHGASADGELFTTAHLIDDMSPAARAHWYIYFGTTSLDKIDQQRASTGSRCLWMATPGKHRPARRPAQCAPGLVPGVPGETGVSFD
jgi:hypothetical protein